MEYNTVYLRNGNDLLSARLIWHDAKLDIALLELELNFYGPPFSVCRTVKAHEPFMGKGFPESGNMGTSVRAISGKVTDPDSEFSVGVPAIHLHCEQAGTSEPLSLHGMSGGPVIINGAVVGIIRNNPQGREKSHIALGGILFATPIHAVMEGCGKLFVVFQEVKQEQETPRHKAEHYLNVLLSSKTILDSSEVYSELNSKLFEDFLIPAARRKLFDSEHSIYLDSADNLDSKNTEKKKIKDFKELSKEILNYRRVALVGDPGAGKTTTLQRLTVEMVRKAQKAFQEEDFPPDNIPPIPLYVSLDTYHGQGFSRFLQENFSGLNLKEYLLKGKITLLLDAWNQMAPEYDNDLKAWIEEHEDISIIASCRKLEYNELNLPLTRIEIDPLNVDLIQTFIYSYLPTKTKAIELFWILSGSTTKTIWAWYYEAVFKERYKEWLEEKYKEWPEEEYKEWIEENYEELFKDFWYGNHNPGPVSWAPEYQELCKLRKQVTEGKLPGMLGVVQNPYLLSLAIKVYAHKEKYEFPKNRGELFDFFVNESIKELAVRKLKSPDLDETQRQNLKEIRNEINKDKISNRATILRMLKEKCPNLDANWSLRFATSIDVEAQKRALVSLAYKMQSSKDKTIIKKDSALEVFREACPDIEAELLLDFSTQANIINGYTKDKDDSSPLRFTHQLLQEYFAAIKMKETLESGKSAEEYFPGENWWESTGWEETAIFLAGMTSNKDGTSDSTPVVRWLLSIQPNLAFRCATESGAKCDPVVLDSLYNPLPGQRISPFAREEWGRIGETEKNPKKKEDPSHIVWCEVPKGEFYMGGDKDVARTYWEGMPINIDYPYAISKYPVTYAQYDMFIEDGGYEVQKYWTESGWEWCKRNNITKPGFWNEVKWNFQNHPVIGVSWYECYAYTKWLTEKLNTIIRLPTEAEWEKAGRYPDNRFFPWGDKYKPGSANIDETDLNAPVGIYRLDRTTAVSSYEHAASQLGICDLSGNTWECLPPYRMQVSP